MFVVVFIQLHYTLLAVLSVV